MNKASKIILIALAILAVLALLGWLGYNNYQQQEQLGILSNYQTKIEGQGKSRYDQKLAELKGRMKDLAKKNDELIIALEKGTLLTDDKEAMRQQLLQTQAELLSTNSQLDTAYYGSEVPEELLDRMASSAMNYMSYIADASQKDSELAKKRIQYYQSKLKVYRDSLVAFVKEREMLVESLKNIEGQLAEEKKGRAELKAERDRLLEALGEKEAALDSLIGDDTQYARDLRRFEDSLSRMENRNMPMYARELKCYYEPKAKSKNGHVMLNEQPIHSPNKIKAILLEFDAEFMTPSAENKVEVVMLKQDVPVKSWDVVATNGHATLKIDCTSDKLEEGNYSFQIKYMGETVRTHKFKLTK